MTAPVREGTSLRRSLSVWQAVGLSVALMAPSMAANINPQGTAGLVGRATPLAFFLAAIAVLLIAYVFVRLCQYYRHAGSVYVFAGATLGPQAGAVAGLGLMGTYVFYAPGHLVGGRHLRGVVPRHHRRLEQPARLGRVPGRVHRSGAGAAPGRSCPAKRAAEVLLTAEGITVALIVVVAAVVLVRMLAGNAPGDAQFTMKVFSVPPGTPTLRPLPRHHLRPAVVRRLRGGVHAGRGDERPAARHPPGHPRHRDLRRHLLHRRHRHRDDGVRPGRQGRRELHRLPGADGRPRYVVHRCLGRRPDHAGCVRVSAFACCLACVVGASRLLFAITRDLAPGSRPGPDRRATPPPRRRQSWCPASSFLIGAHLRGLLRREAVRHVLVERHDRHPDPAGRLRAGDDRLHQADLDRQEDAAGADAGRS